MIHLLRFLGFLLSIVAAFFFPFALIEPLARIFVPAIALMTAGIFPSMTLVVSAMRGEERTPSLVEQLYEKLKNILRILVAAFISALLSIALITLTVLVYKTECMAHKEIWLQALVLLSFVAIFILVDRILAMLRTFFSILDLNLSQALIVAKKNNKHLFGDIRNNASFESEEY